ncbi:MAG: hypothetical protein WKF94_01860 [Solirubrobacteraceae bacterium]
MEIALDALDRCVDERLREVAIAVEVEEQVLQEGAGGAVLVDRELRE